MTIKNILSRLNGVKKTRTGWVACCPAHEDMNASLSITVNKNGTVLLFCHAGCKYEAIIAGLSKLPIINDFVNASNEEIHLVAIYTYYDEDGMPIYQVLRYEPKTFKQRRITPNGKYIYNMNGVRRVLYKLPEILAANLDQWLFIVEGEKDADNLMKIGLLATTCSGGAKKWHLTDSQALNGRKIAIVPDNDHVGKEHALDVAKDLIKRVKEIRIIELPDLPPKGDVSDWLSSGGNRERLIELV